MTQVTEAVVGLGMNADLRQYAQWEDVNAEWLLASALRSRRRPARTWAVRIRYWLNSFRGFATFDIRGTNDRPAH